MTEQQPEVIEPTDRPEPTASAEQPADTSAAPAATAAAGPAPETPEPRAAQAQSAETPATPEPPATPAVPPVPGARPAGEGAPRRRLLAAVALWAAAAVLCGGLGAGVTAGITAMERTDVPGLATADDGRWAYPKLALPALAEGAPRPFSEGNEGEIHHADLRKLLLPAPAGGTAHKTLTGGWTGVDAYLSEYAPDKRAGLKQALADSALRHIAARGWTMPDGTSTRIYLVQFHSVAYAEAFKDEEIEIGMTAGTPLVGNPDRVLDEDWSASAAVRRTSAYVYEETKPYGPEQTRLAYVLAGDTFAMIVQSRKGAAAEVPFHQTVILQNQLLG